MIFRIFNKDLPVRSLMFVLGEGILTYTVVLLSASFSWPSTDTFFFSGQVFTRALLVMVVCLIALYFNDLYNLKATDTYLEIGRRLTKAMGVASIVLALIYYCLPSLLVARGPFAFSLLFLILLGVSWRYAYNCILKKKMFTEKVLIVGTGALFADILAEVSGRCDSGYEVAGVVSTISSSTQSLTQEIPLFDLERNIVTLAESMMVRKIVVAMDQRRGSLPTAELLRCKMQGIEILDGESFYEKMTGKIPIEKIHPSWFIFSEGFRKSIFTPVVKRISDLILASAGLLFTSPFFLIIAVAIKLESKGPIIFKQLRCGEGERTFELCKFRSMIDNAEAASGPTWAQDDDWRVTRVGKILRKYRLDEIPQMWNVLRGNMSFVGPRPERPEFVEKLKESIPFYSERHTVKPGLTGWAQISFGYGACVDDALQKLKYDLFYIKNMTILMDLMIVLRTIKVVLNNKAVNQSPAEQATSHSSKTSDLFELSDRHI